MGLIAGSAALMSCQQKTQANEERPNILFILSDDHTSQAWGIYGGILQDYVKNDNIRRLASEGCVLDNCLCTNSISVPSRASIMTGAYSHVNGVYTLDDAIDPAEDNIAKQMQAGGYQTALFGKWHLKRKPTGFDHFEVFHDQGEYWNPLFKSEANWVDDTEGKQGVEEKGFSTDIVTEKVIQWIKQRDKTRPFMMCCHFKATHEPWDFPDRMKHLYDDVVFPMPENMMEFDQTKSGRTFPGQQLENMGWRWETASKDPDSWWCRYPELPFSTQGMDRDSARIKIYQKMIRDYLRCGATIDDNIGKLLKMLDEEGLAQNTIVIYVSDQGYFLGEHGFFDKRMMYEEPLHMPFVIRYPKEIKAGTRNKDIILNIDFAVLRFDPQLAHFINLYVDEENSDENNVVVILKHNAYEDPTTALAFGRVSFDISKLVPEGKSSIFVTLRWSNYDNMDCSDSGTFYLPTDGSSSGLNGIKDNPEGSSSAAYGAIK